VQMYLTIALRNLLQAKRRTFFLSAALGMVTMLLVLLLALTQGMTETLIKSATTISAGHVNVGGFFKSTSTDAAPIITGVDDIRKVVLENTPDLDYIVGRHKGWGRVVSDTASLNAGLWGVDMNEEGRFAQSIQLAKESEYKEGGRDEVLGDVKRLANPKSAMIFATQAKRLGVTVGDNLTIMVELLTGARNTTEVTIVAVGKDVGMMSNWSVFVDKGTTLDLYRLAPDTSGAIFVYLKDISKCDQTMAHLRGVFEQKGYKVMEHESQPFWMKFEKVQGEDWLGQKLDFTIWSDEVSFVKWVFTAIDTISFFLIGVLLLIIVIGIMNSMYISVRERTKEVGTVRAIGMSKRGVLFMFVTEAVLLGLFATTVGGVVGASIAAAIDAARIVVPVEAVQAILMSDTIHLSVLPGQIVAAVLVFTTVTVVAALWPSVRASRLQPVEAIHAVG
jgi:putative ABC transport system permease protein